MDERSKAFGDVFAKVQAVLAELREGAPLEDVERRVRNIAWEECGVDISYEVRLRLEDFIEAMFRERTGGVESSESRRRSAEYAKHHLELDYIGIDCGCVWHSRSHGSVCPTHGTTGRTLDDELSTPSKEPPNA